MLENISIKNAGGVLALANALPPSSGHVVGCVHNRLASDN
jgi:hypothetical protein